MFKIVCVTDRKLCSDFTERIEKLYKNGITVILREKDLSGDDYKELARRIISVCPDVILHSYINEAADLGAKKIHLPLHMMNKSIKSTFETVGVSVHSPEEAKAAEKMGADYVTAGHIFATDCKKGLEPRGLDFLERVKRSVNIPVYGIGGISPRNISQIKERGADGACIMSGFMQCENIEKYLEEISENLLKK
ncbi:MAG: thiamine phosphate synthase [Oscillospiraceae bacterium]|nr:thiamine phosphate synthase [Oscillospiraceae bacterium]